MPRIVSNARQFTADRPWGAMNLVDVEGASVRLHWTDQPYVWHENDGSELFCVIDGAVDMHFIDGDEERVTRLEAGDMFVADVGDRHVAHPVGEARILVVEKKGSV